MVNYLAYVGAADSIQVHGTLLDLWNLFLIALMFGLGLTDLLCAVPFGADDAYDIGSRKFLFDCTLVCLDVPVWQVELARLDQPVAAFTYSIALLSVPVDVAAMCPFWKLVHSFLQSFVEKDVATFGLGLRLLGLTGKINDLQVHSLEVIQIE